MSLKIGILVSEPQLPGEVWRNCAALALETMQQSHRLDYDIEFIEENAEGLPTGSVHSVCEAWQRLADQGVLAIVGPATADNAMAIREVADAGKVPTVTITATSYAASDWTFSVSWGSGPEDAFRMVDWLHATGCKSMAVIWDTMWHSGEFLEYLEIAGKRAGVRITGQERISMRIRDMGQPSDVQMSQARTALENLRSTGPDALAVGTALATAAVGLTLRDMQWDIPVVCNISLGIGRGPKAAGAMQGWVGSSIFDESNLLACQFLKTYESRFGAVYHTDFQLTAHDAFRVLLEGFALAPIMTRRGLYEGLEKIKLFPTAIGGPGCYLGFGPNDHRALKGQNMIVLRRLLEQGAWEKVDGIPFRSLQSDAGA